MIKWWHIIFLSFCLFYFNTDTAQSNPLDIQLANNYFLEGDYEKAILYYEKIAQDESDLLKIYDYYKTALINNNQFKEAEKLCKVIMKNNPMKLFYQVHLGSLYGAWDKKEKQEQQFKKTISSISPETSYVEVVALGLAFEKIGDLKRALSVYEIGADLNSTNPYAYHSKIALLYNKMGDTEKMIKTYIDQLNYNEGFLISVQNGLSNSIDFEIQHKEKEILRRALLKQVQLNPKKTIYVQLLAWFYMSLNDYENAFVQIKSLDKKLKMDGKKILDLGNTAFNNEDYDVAIKCYEEVSNSTQSIERKLKAETKRLNALKNKLITGGLITNSQLMELKSNYLKTLYILNGSGENQHVINRKYELLKQLSDLEAYYLHDVEAANKHLNQAKVLSGINERDRGEIKLMLADILVLENKIWEASLLYMQIEKQFKNDPLGHKAKFYNARVYYFAGEFDWAQAQLDILKASTSKLIANDAIELSVLITDNYNMDTSETAMKLFSYADMLRIQHQYEASLACFDTLLNKFHDHTLNDDILIRKSKVFSDLHQYDSAIFQLEQLTASYPSSILYDNALFLLGDIYQFSKSDSEKAIIYYKELLFNYPGSIYVVEARKRYRKLVGITNENIIKGS